MVEVTDAGLKVGGVRTLNVPETQNAAPAGTPAQKAVPKAKPVPTEAFIAAQTPLPGARVTTGNVVSFDIIRK
jgi:hypothetical protein